MGGGEGEACRCGDVVDRGGDRAGSGDGGGGAQGDSSKCTR